MKVWVVLASIPYEGYGEPQAVFSNPEAAQSYADENNITKRSKWNKEQWDVYEMEVQDE